jgi:hypothetical protein
MSTYEEHKSTRANFIIILDVYLGNPLMSPPLKSFSNYLQKLDAELLGAGGNEAPPDVLASQIKDYNRIIVYISKLIANDRDSQILVDAEEFYLNDVTDVTQSFGTIHVGNTTDKLHIVSLPTPRSITTELITSSPGLIATYTTPRDYFINSSTDIRGGVSYLELYAEKTSGERDLGVFIDLSEVESDGTTEVANITSGLITESVKKTNCTIIDSYDKYNIK